MKIIFLGAPGAGKGTQAEIVSEKFDIPAISTGAIIREAIKSETEMGIEAKKFIEAGELIADNVVIGIVKERLANSDCQNGFILDGFPRTVPQAEALDGMGVELDHVISIEVPDKEIVDRMAGRRVCPKCGATYHVIHNPSADGEKCDKCKEELTSRRDDAPEVVLSRLEVYHSTTEPLKEFYTNKGVLRLVDGVGSVEEISYRTMKVLEV